MATKPSRRHDPEVHLGSSGQIVGRLYLGRDELMKGAPYFRLDAKEAAAIWTEVTHAVNSWRVVAKGLGMRGTDLLDFEPAFA